MTSVIAAIIVSPRAGGLFGWVAAVVIVSMAVLAVRCFTTPSPK